VNKNRYKIDMNEKCQELENIRNSKIIITLKNKSVTKLKKRKERLET